MKKLLNIFNFFGVITPNSLLIIACSKEDKQKVNHKVNTDQAIIDDAESKLEALKNVEVRMINLKAATLDNVIENLKTNEIFTKIVDGTNVKLNGDLKLSKNADGTVAVAPTDFKHGLTAHVSGKIQHATNAAIETDFNFTARIKDEFQATIDDAEAKLEALEGIEIQIENFTNNTSLKSVIDEIKKHQKFTNIVDGVNVQLDSDLKLSKDMMANHSFTSTDFKHDKVGYVSGIISHPNKSTIKAEFKFLIRLKNQFQFEVNQTAKHLVQTLEKYELKLNLTTVTTKIVIDEIKKHQAFAKIVNNEKIKLDGELKLTKTDENNNSYLVNSIDLIDGATINVLGKIQHAVKPIIKAEFRFVIKLVNINSGIKKSKFDLSNISINVIPSLYIDANKTYFQLNEQIVDVIQQINDMKNIPLPKGYEIKYYVLSSKFSNNEFSYARILGYEKQKEGSIWIEITAGLENLTWKGSTNLLQFSLTKRNLNQEIKTLTNIFHNDLELKIVNATNYMHLNEQIVNAYEFKDKPITKYIIKYFTWNDDLYSYGWYELNQEEKPESDYVYVEISATTDESLWKGETERILIWIND